MRGAPSITRGSVKGRRKRASWCGARDNTAKGTVTAINRQGASWAEAESASPFFAFGSTLLAEETDSDAERPRGERAIATSSGAKSMGRFAAR